MKFRSAEALARRAERRGRTVEEQQALDRGQVPGKPKVRRKDSAEPQQVPKPVKQMWKRVPKGDPSKAWVNSIATPERLEENKQLRERYKAHPSSLTDEERSRAEALLARDARKRAKKEAIRAEKASQASMRRERNAQSHENRKRKRKEESQAAKHAKPRQGGATED